MTETAPKDSEASSIQKSPKPLKKGTLVRVNREKFSSSLEAKASDPLTPEYIFKGPGEVLNVKGDFAQIRWKRPVPDSWLRLDQLEIYANT